MKRIACIIGLCSHDVYLSFNVLNVLIYGRPSRLTIPPDPPKVIDIL